MRKSIPTLLILPAIALGGCSLLAGKTKPLDEFAVARNAPLVIPPDYSLTPPVAGTVSSTAVGAQAHAVEALFGGPAPRSRSEATMLDNAGRDRAVIGARSVAGDPDTRVVDKGAQTQAIIAAPEANSAEATAQPPK